MREQVEEWILHEIAWTKENHGNMDACYDRCYGALMFVLSQNDDDALALWWWEKVAYPYIISKRG